MKKLSMLITGLTLATGVLAGAADQLSVQDPYVRLAPPNAPATGAFMVIRNGGDKDVKVLKADNPVSRVTELHTHLNEGGVMKMRPVAAIEVKAKGEAVLKPGGLHVMMIDLKAPMKEGDVVPITLTLDDGSTKQVDAKVVRPMAAPAPAPMPMMEHKH
ncbi:copper chaperone PCu(A)C [Dechloromonas denitrificans]|uniref:copper chaperone PCu(A)C n=1 Tax=Dechloromonas denitrificans TaxID=281362 RepID=UPI001CF8E3E9|nr:copper chaperone PCu(A)C [Dechloromonas denitrificans]UCV05373.1 copper chaperone PCu(A)C [Dechloromonas denitrificans]